IVPNELRQRPGLRVGCQHPGAYLGQIRHSRKVVQLRSPFYILLMDQELGSGFRAVSSNLCLGHVEWSSEPDFFERLDEVKLSSSIHKTAHDPDGDDAIRFRHVPNGVQLRTDTGRR